MLLKDLKPGDAFKLIRNETHYIKLEPNSRIKGMFKEPVIFSLRIENSCIATLDVSDEVIPCNLQITTNPIKETNVI